VGARADRRGGGAGVEYGASGTQQPRSTNLAGL
jgi:hypothetical protein